MYCPTYPPVGWNNWSSSWHKMPPGEVTRWRWPLDLAHG